MADKHSSPESKGDHASDHSDENADWYLRRINALRRAMHRWGAQSELFAGQRTSGSPNVDPFQGIVPASIDAIVEARHAFSEDARSLISTTLLMFSASGALIIAPFAASNVKTEGALVCFGLAGVVFVLVFPVTTLLNSTAKAGYELYVANCVNSAIIHRAVGVGSVMAQATESDSEFEARFRRFSDLPHAWLDGVERSRSTQIRFKLWKVNVTSWLIDSLRFVPLATGRWGNREQTGAKSAPKEFPADPRDMNAVWKSMGQTLQRSLDQMIIVAKVAAVVGLVIVGLLMNLTWTNRHVSEDGRSSNTVQAKAVVHITCCSSECGCVVDAESSRKIQK